ncbi:hypothetical protein T484DRAFT_1808146, partial [Baffinella frigidus]
DCGLFLVIFIMVIFAYAQAFHISFGTGIEEYKTLPDAAFRISFGTDIEECKTLLDAAFHISFGTDIEEYKTLLDAVFGLFKTLLGDFDFEAIKLINPYLGPLLFITFEVVCYFVFLNTFLAILNKSYSDVVCYFVFLNMFLAILNKSYSDVLDKGVDDPMAVEFRATMYLGRVRDVVFFWRRNDDLDRFKEDEDGEEEGGEEKEPSN